MIFTSATLAVDNKFDYYKKSVGLVKENPKKIDEKIGLSTLSYPLQELARARLDNEDMSLEELGNILNITKSGIRGRFRRIKEIYL